MERKTNKLDSIQSLRGIAVLLVIAFHFRVYLNNAYSQSDIGDLLFGIGEIGVDIFFVISGFIITYSTANKENNRPLDFSIKRFFRLYPVYIIVLSILICFNLDEIYTFSQIVKSYLLIPIDYNFIGPWSGYSIIIPAWTLTYEIWFYIVFCMAIAISHKYRTVVASALLISICIISQLYFHGEISLNPVSPPPGGDTVIRNFVFVSNPIIYDFILGMIAAEMYIKCTDAFISSKIITHSLFILMLIAIIFIALGINRGPGVTAWGLYSFMIITPIVLISKFRNVFSNSVLSYVGEISYSLYINHMVIHSLGVTYLKQYGIFDARGFCIFLSLIIATFVLSIVTYNLIEKPSVKLGNIIVKLLRKDRSSAQIAIAQ